jgi:hypothetical protein
MIETIDTAEAVKKSMRRIESTNESALKGLEASFGGTLKRARVFTILEEYLANQKSGSIKELKRVLMRYCYVSGERALVWIDELSEMGFIEIRGSTWYYNSEKQEQRIQNDRVNNSLSEGSKADSN